MKPAAAAAATAAEPAPLEPANEPAVGRGLLVHLVLFGLTLASVWHAGALYTRPDRFSPDTGWPLEPIREAYADAWQFALPLITILLLHEFGHYCAARWHRVPASLPYFLPLPVLSPFGTLGAVIAMRDRIRSRQALMDIGASGPLAGLLAAIPLMLVGLSYSTVEPLGNQPYAQEGQCLLYAFLKWCVHGPIPTGYDVHLHATAFAAWVGLLVTMVNLVPWGQLDGGHIAYALWGERQNRFARWVRYGLLVLVAYNLLHFVQPVLHGESSMPLDLALSNSSTWFVWFVLTWVLGALFGHSHPPCEAAPLGLARRRVGWLCVAVFVSLLMPTPFAYYPGASPLPDGSPELVRAQ